MVDDICFELSGGDESEREGFVTRTGSESPAKLDGYRRDDFIKAIVACSQIPDLGERKEWRYKLLGYVLELDDNEITKLFFDAFSYKMSGILRVLCTDGQENGLALYSAEMKMLDVGYKMRRLREFLEDLDADALSKLLPFFDGELSESLEEALPVILHLAVTEGNMDLLSEVLKYKDKINIPVSTSSGWSPLFDRSGGLGDDVLEYLNSMSAPRDFIYAAAIKYAVKYENKRLFNSLLSSQLLSKLGEVTIDGVSLLSYVINATGYNDIYEEDKLYFVERILHFMPRSSQLDKRVVPQAYVGPLMSLSMVADTINAPYLVLLKLVDKLTCRFIEEHGKITTREGGVMSCLEFCVRRDHSLEMFKFFYNLTIRESVRQEAVNAVFEYRRFDIIAYLLRAKRELCAGIKYKKEYLGSAITDLCEAISMYDTRERAMQSRLDDAKFVMNYLSNTWIEYTLDERPALRIDAEMIQSKLFKDAKPQVWQAFVTSADEDVKSQVIGL